MASNPTIVLTAQDSASRVLASVRGEMSRLDSVAGKLKGVLGTLGVGITAGAFTTFVRSTIDGVDALNDLKDATGASIENLSALEDIAARTGTSIDAVGTSLVKFNSALSAAKPGSDAARAFEALGLSVQELKALDPAEALRRTAVALAGFADDGNKARLTQELFGKSLREVAPFLADLASQGQLVAKVTTDQALAAEKFNQQLAALAKNSVDAARELSLALLPAINRVLSDLVKISEKDLLGVFFKEGIKSKLGLGSLTDNPLADLNKLTQERTRLLGEQAKKFEKGVENQRVIALIADNEKLISLTRIRLGLTDGQAGGGRGFVNPAAAVGTGKPSLPSGFDPAAKTKEEAASRASVTTELDRYFDSLTKALEKEQDLTEVQVAQRRIAEAGAQGFSEAQRAAILGLAARIDKERELKQEREDLLEQAVKLDAAMTAGDEAVKRRLESLLANTPTKQLEEAQRDQLLLAEAFKAGAISEQQYLEAASARAGITAATINETKDAAEKLNFSFASAFEDAIVGGKKFSEVLKSIQQDILRILVRKNITEPFGNFISGAVSNLFGGFFANGGDPPLGKISVVGEKGPELFMPRTAGTIIPNGAGGANVTIVNQIAVGDVASVSTVREAMATVTRNMQAQIARSITRGGALA